MKMRIALGVTLSLGLSGCALFVSDDQLARSDYAARDPFTNEGGPLFEGPLVAGGQLRGETEAPVMADDIGGDVWGGEDIRVTGVIDDDLGLNDGVVN